ASTAAEEDLSDVRKNQTPGASDE
ncbi:MAG: hypothetical protein QOC87_1768, partial [Actinomycetota bacterium]|nr:hypothetical protein [Actinomycetota bacterium]